MDSTLPRLLVIDDEPGICLAVSLLLQDLFAVVTAETAKEGLARLSESYALILLDLRMPGVNGYDLLDSVRQKASSTPIAILSATGDRRTHDEVLQRGAVALIEKPFSRQELVTRIRQILDASKES
jgi:DNA-binding response OmpR family regulator